MQVSERLHHGLPYLQALRSILAIVLVYKLLTNPLLGCPASVNQADTPSLEQAEKELVILCFADDQPTSQSIAHAYVSRVTETDWPTTNSVVIARRVMFPHWGASYFINHVVLDRDSLPTLTELTEFQHDFNATPKSAVLLSEEVHTVFMFLEANKRVMVIIEDSNLFRYRIQSPKLIKLFTFTHSLTSAPVP